jgi:cytochrome c
VLILTFTVMFMGVGRQIYRATALAPHQQAVQESTRQYEESLQQLPKP